jgi:hypothetical protein
VTTGPRSRRPVARCADGSPNAAPQKISGPAAYFPSIEKKYGQPIAHWLNLVGQQSGMKHMEIVNWLKTEHGMGHGHANAVVAYSLAKAER